MVAAEENSIQIEQSRLFLSFSSISEQPLTPRANLASSDIQLDFADLWPQGNSSFGLESIEKLREGCDVALAIMPSYQYPQTVFPLMMLIDNYYGAPPEQEVLVLPSNGGVVRFDFIFENLGNTALKLRRWATVTLPNGLQMSGIGVGTRKPKPGMPYIEENKAFSILKNYPDGLYIYTLHAADFNDLSKVESTSFFIYKGIDSPY